MGVLGLHKAMLGHLSVPETALPVAATCAVTISRSRACGRTNRDLWVPPPKKTDIWCLLFVLIRHGEHWTPVGALDLHACLAALGVEYTSD